MNPLPIQRRPDARRFLVVRTERAGDVIAALEGRRRVLVSDLALGPARPHHVAHELAEQLAITLSVRRQDSGESDSAQNIDRESRGDPQRLAALAHAEQLATALDAGAHHLVIIGPRFGLVWGDANEELLRFVADVLTADEPRITLILAVKGGEPATALGRYLPRAAPRPSGRRASFVDPAQAARPGLVSSGIPRASRGVRVFTTELGVRLVEPKHRRLDVGALPMLRLAPQTGDDAFELQAAERCYARTGNAVDLYRLQRSRLDARAFEAAALEPLDFRAPEALRRQILGTIGYAAAMRGDPALACSLLEALSPGASPSNSEDLYLRNTYALALARSGRLNSALAVEYGVREAFGTRPSQWHLQIVNLLNIARLHRSLGWTRKARLSFLAWERAMRGQMVEAEFLQCSSALARSAQALGDAREAFRRWLRVALHWVAQQQPEALSWRAASALAGGWRQRCDVDEVCAALIEQLSLASRAAGIRKPVLREAPTFAYARRSSTKLACVVGSGFSVLAGDATMPPVYDSALHRRLRALVGALLRATVGTHAAAPTYLIDASHGYDLPVSLSEARDSAVRYAVGTWICRGVRQQVQRIPSSREPRVRVSAAVNAVTASTDRVRVSFKRHWAPVYLGEASATLLRGVMTRAPLRSELPPRILHKLEDLRVLRVSK